ncbi:MAG: nucleotidyltransferase [Chloroflexi bacterium RBG_19FT_COMBO_50_10]|nr:MAG: nucleotidyltransferase [Chloroflexi bacterium RBG_19FT_COMBO_50_10]
MRSDRERLLDILEAIDRIDTHKGDDRLEFDTDALLQVWFVHHLQIIGEAASRLSDEIRAQFPEVPWGQMIGMRHILVHGYFDVDLEIVWNAAQVNLVQLKVQIEDILRHMGNSE